MNPSNHSVFHDLIEFAKSQFVIIVLVALIVLNGMLVLHLSHHAVDFPLLAWAEKVSDGFIGALLLALNVRGVGKKNGNQGEEKK